MKLRNFALVLTTAALLPTFAHADAVSDSFERDMNHKQVVSQNTGFVGTTDPFADVFYAALSGTTDAVLASFERDMNHEPVSQDTVFASSADPLADLFYAALYGRTETGLASFERDMNREPNV